MKIFSSLNKTHINAIISIVLGICFLIGCSLFSGGGKTTGGNSPADKSGTGFKVWVKTSPCSGGRTDWISIAKENPGFGGGGSFFQTADLLTSGVACTKISDNNCTFSEAMTSANSVRGSSQFVNYCCRDYSVWKYAQSGEMTIVKSGSSAGFGWQFEKGNLCCEEAEELSGKKGVCSSPALGSHNGSGTPRRDGNSNRTGDGGQATPAPYSTPYSTPIQTPVSTPPPTIGRWTLVSVTAIPNTPPKGYSYNAQSTSVHLDVYNGNTHDFQWTKPPAQFDANGFTVALNTQCKPIPKNACASLMGVRGNGLESDTPPGERKAEATGADGAGASGQKSVTFKPSLSSPNELEVEVGLMWGAAQFIYKYRKE